MTDSTLNYISYLVYSRITGHLPDDVQVDRVFSEYLPAVDGDEYVRTTVVLEDGHPDLDPRILNEFSQLIYPLCISRGLEVPFIAYADKSEYP